MPIMSTAGSKLSIGTALAQKADDFVLADFSSLTFTRINPLEGLGTVGDSSEAINFDDIGSKRRRKLKGVRDAGTMEVVTGLDYSDPGQIALIAAEKADGDHAFKLEAKDGSIRYFIAMVMSANEAFDTANNVTKMNYSLAVNSNLVRQKVGSNGSLATV